MIFLVIIVLSKLSSTNMVDYAYNLQRLKMMCEFVEKYDEVEFSLNCICAGIGDCATKTFFDETLFPLMFDSVPECKILKYVMNLKRNISKLQRIYDLLPF